MSTETIITLVVIAVVILYIIMKYNGFVTLKNRAKEAWSDVSIQIQRRYELVPNLVSTVQGYAKHEASTFENVIKARNIAMNYSEDSLDEMAKNENMLSGTLKSLFAVTESYPELQANENFLHLQAELVDIEDKLKASRRFYNANVRSNNTALEHFPGNIIANLFKFEKFVFFELDEEDAKAAKKAPKVSF